MPTLMKGLKQYMKETNSQYKWTIVSQMKKYNTVKREKRRRIISGVFLILNIIIIILTLLTIFSKHS